MKTLFLSTLFICFVELSFANQTFAQNSETEVSFCQFPISDSAKLGHSNFSLIYTFRINMEGKPTKIKTLRDFPIAQVNEKQVIDCISEWKFFNLQNNTFLIAHFKWQHGQGWSEIVIEGKGFKQKIKITGEKCPFPTKSIDK